MNTPEARKRIDLLLVEDSLTAALLITDYLEATQGAEFDIVHVRNLKEAMDRLSENRFDAVLLDLGLPDSYGLETFSRIKEAAAEIPIVVFTGVSDEQTALEAVRLGAQDYLVKGQVTSSLVSRSLLYAIERKQIEEKLKEKTAQLIQTEKLSAMGELTAGVTHEINQPLNSMKITCEDILLDIKRNRLDVNYVKESLEELIREINRLADIVDHLRRFTRRTDSAQWERFDAGAPIESVLKLLGRQLAIHGFEVEVEQEPGLRVEGDLVRIQQVIMNLLTNARNAVEKNAAKKGKRIGIKLFRRPPRDDDPAWVVYEISDNGVGIPEGVIHQVFEPFFTTKKAAEGTGLGLTIVWQIIEEHKGKILLESREGKGTVFRVLLPSTEEEKKEDKVTESKLNTPVPGAHDVP